MESIKVGLLGVGTVGSGTYHVLTRNQQEITRRAGRAIEICVVGARSAQRARSLVGEGVRIESDLDLVVHDPAGGDRRGAHWAVRRVPWSW